MPTISIASNIIRPLDAQSPFAHLQLVFEDTNGDLFEIEVQAPPSVLAGNFDFASAAQSENNQDRDHTVTAFTSAFDGDGQLLRAMATPNGLSVPTTHGCIAPMAGLCVQG